VVTSEPPVLLYDLVLPAPDRTHSDTQFEEALPLAFSIPKNAVDALDCYIDDLCSICIDINENGEMCAAAVTLTFDVVGRPLDPQDPLLHDALANKKK
jgi:hypothetical protein